MTNVLDLAARGNAEDLLLDMRVRSLYSSYYFAKVVLGYSKLSEGFHQPEMEMFLTNWSRDVRKQAIEWSRGFYKTTCFTISTGIWVVLPVRDEDTQYALYKLGLSEAAWLARVKLHDRDATQLLAFETDDNAKRKVRSIKWHFEENELFRMLFPEIAYAGTEHPWNDNSLKIRRAGKRARDAEGTFDAIGVGGALQSRHYVIVWEDDLVGEKARKSPVVMEDTIGWHGRLHGAFENATQQIRFLVSNRWGYADLNSHVRANEPDFYFHTRSAIELDPETGQERAAFPEEYPLDKILQIRDSGSMTRYDFSCQYLNTPQMPGEREVDLGKLHYYTVESDGRISCSCGAKLYVSACNRYLHYDPYNAKGAGSTSCPALVVVAASVDEHIILLDYWTNKGAYAKVYERMFHLNDIWRPSLMTYEDVGHQNLNEFHIRTIEKTTEFAKAKHRRFPRIEGIAPGMRSKEVRVREGLFPYIENKKFSCRKTQTLFTQQLETFPNRALDHDYDLLDALAQGSARWRFPEAQDSDSRRKAEEEEYLAAMSKPYGYTGAAVV